MAQRVNAVMESLLADAVARLLSAAHGQKEPIYAAFAERSGLSLGSAKRLIGERMRQLRQPRKRRSDSGESTLTIDEARLISTYLMESRRKTGKQLADIEAAVETLRADGLITAGRVDVQTGEFAPMSISAISRALKVFGYHPAQLEQPAPKVELRTLHPNHCWQIDPSLCVLYYLKTEDGLRAMPADEFYKNKPRNLARVEHERVWRYVFADHTTSAFYVEYVLGAESGENLCSTFIGAMQPRGEHDPFHGVPRMVMLDPGSANTGAMFRNLCAVLNVQILINKPKTPWAKGSVEKHNDIIECEFEHRLKFYRVQSLADLNTAAWNWAIAFQIRAVHSRHGMTRFQAWQKIAPTQLRVPPPADVCRSLATHAPQERTVTPQLRVSFRGKEYDVRQVPNVIPGQKLLVARNAWRDDDSAYVLGIEADGIPTQYIVPELRAGEFGFTDAAVTLGEYHSHKDTPADTHRKEIERIAMGARTDEEAATKRKAGTLPFEGKIKPQQPVAPQVAYIPRRGTQMQVDAPSVVDLTVPRVELPEIKRQFPPLTHYQAAYQITPKLNERGLEWSAAMWEETVRRYPDGVPDEEINAWADELFQRHRLRLVPLQQQGGAA